MKEVHGHQTQILKRVKTMTSEELRQYMDRNTEGDYLIVDVRQPDEYVRGHIPGAKLIPVRDLVLDPSELPSDKDIIFY